MTPMFEGQPPKTRLFPIKTGVRGHLGSRYTHIGIRMSSFLSTTPSCSKKKISPWRWSTLEIRCSKKKHGTWNCPNSNNASHPIKIIQKQLLNKNIGIYHPQKINETVNKKTDPSETLRFPSATKSLHFGTPRHQEGKNRQLRLERCVPKVKQLVK